MNNSTDWYKEREEWRNITKPYPENSPDIYQPEELTLEVCETINDVIISVKGPYPPFPKKINLADLASLVEEIWDDDD